MPASPAVAVVAFAFRQAGRGYRGSRLQDLVNKGPSYSRTVFRGDNVEAGDFFPTGSCDVVMLAESRKVYRVIAG